MKLEWVTAANGYGGWIQQARGENYTYKIYYDPTHHGVDVQQLIHTSIRGDILVKTIHMATETGAKARAQAWENQ